MAEIPHRWYYQDKPCEMLGPVYHMIRRQVVALTISQDGKVMEIPLDDEGGYPGLTYELLH